MLSVVVGGQFGSEAKGTVTAWLAQQCLNPVVVRVGGPNAGHTVYDDGGREWKLRQIPVGFVNPGADLVISAGSEIDLEVLHDEITELEAAGHTIRNRLFIDGEATVLTQTHRAMETASELTAYIGSTGKGVGGARADRVMRNAERIKDLGGVDWTSADTVSGIRASLRDGQPVIIEGTQGYGLGLHAGYYPFCTSSDVRAIDFMSQVGISPWQHNIGALNIWIVYRTRPIRVAGNSGMLHGETTWGELGLPDEYTTVTKKVRRVGEWDPDLALRALEANGHPSPCTRVAMMMVDQMFPEVAGMTSLSPEAAAWIGDRETELGHPIDLVGTGPQSLISYCVPGG